MNTGKVRGRFLFREVNERGYDLPLGSVTKDGGVEFRRDLDISVWNPSDDVSGYKRVQPDDFVIGLRSFQSGIGHSSIEALVSPAYTVLRPISADIHPPFFRHLFKSTSYISQLENVAQGIRQGRTVAAADFYNIECPVPSLQVQRAIADFLDSETARIDALIAKKQRMIDLLGLRRLTLISNGVWGLLESSDLSGVGAWRPCPLKHVLSANDGGIWGDDPTPDSATAVIRSTEITMSGEWRLDDVEYRAIDAASRKFKSLKTGDLVVVKSSGSVAHLGKTAIVTSEVEALGACFANFVQRLRLGPAALPRFTWYVLNSSRAATEMEIAGNTTTGLRNLNAEVIGSVTFPGAPLGIQQKIVSELDQRIGQISLLLSTLERQIKLLREHRQALITAAVTGQIEIPGVAA